jgi:hypothetical protein
VENKTFSGTVTVFSGMVATGKSVPILNFLCGFCRGDEGESLHSNGFLKISLWWSGSIQEGGG